MRVLFLLIALLWAWPGDAGAVCQVHTDARTYSDGSTIYPSCDENGKLELAGGGSVESLTLASSVTTNTTSTAVAGLRGNKTFWGEVVGTGALTATIKIYGARTATAANGVLVATITLSGNDTVVDSATPSFAVYPYYYVVISNLTGTSATARAEVFY